MSDSRPKAPAARPSRFNVLIPISGGRTLAFNGVSSVFALWEASDIRIYESLGSGEVSIDDTRLFDFLRGGFVVADGVDEIDRAEKNYRVDRYFPGNMTLTLVPTLKCNFACDYCFQGQEKDKIDMSPQVQDSVIGFIEKSAKHINTLHVAWYGGEPLLRVGMIEDLSKRIIPIARDYSLKYSSMVVTNGWNLTREAAQTLYDCYVRTIQVTLDGPPDYHNSRRPLVGGQQTFERIVGNLKAVVDSVASQFTIRVNIDERNRHMIESLIDTLDAEGLSGRRNFGLYFAPVEAITIGCHCCADVSIGKKSYAKLEAELWRYALEKKLTGMPYPPRHYGNCAAVRPKGFVVHPNGDLHKCWNTINDPGCRVGTIFDTSTIRDNGEYRRWLDWSPFADPACRECTIVSNCSGFCAYKTLYSDRTQGEAAVQPCPGWKNNIAERLFLRAEKLGFVNREDWIPGTDSSV